MMHSANEDFQLYISRVRPIYHQLFNMAHAITGSCDLAEYSLQYALTDYWAANTGVHHGFREGLRNTLIHAAMRTAQSQAEFTWNGLSCENPEEESDPIRRLIAQESIELRRILALKYGCGLSLGRIGRIMAIEPKRIQTALNRFEARCKHKLEIGLRRRFDGLLTQIIKGDFNLPSPLAPDMGNVMRTFQSDAAALNRPSRLPAKIVQAVLAVVMAAICIGGFWLAAVLTQPHKPEETAGRIITRYISSIRPVSAISSLQAP